MRAAPVELIAFCEREYPRLVGSLGLYCGDRHVAEDVAQETLVRVARDWGRVRSMRAPQAWAHRVAINLANSHYRRRQAEARANERSSRGADGVHHDADPGDAMAVRAAVARLQQRQRAAIVLRFYLGHSLAEVAQLMDAPLGTVKSLIHRGVAALRDDLHLDELDEPEADHAR